MNKKYFIFFVFLLSNNFGEYQINKAFAREIGNLVPFVYICYRIINGIAKEKSDIEKLFEEINNRLNSRVILDSKEINKLISDYNKRIDEKKKGRYGVKFMNFIGKAFAATILGSILYYKVGDHKINSLVKKTLIEKWA